MVIAMKKNGFTLLELMVTLAVIAIVLTIGVPSFQSVIRNNRLTTQINSLLGAINLARSKAITLDATFAATDRPRRVAICATVDGTSCSGANDWSKGWIVFLSRDASNLDISGNSDILKFYEGVPSSNYTLNANGSFVAYDKTGLSKKLDGTPATAISFALCYNTTTGSDYSRALNVTLVGRAEAKATATTCTP